MRVSKPLGNGVTIHAEAETMVELFEQLAKMTEVFGEPDAVKGQEHGKDLVFRVRKVEDDKFYELWCPSLKAKLPFGVSKKGGDMYPKRLEVDENGKAVKDENGKVTYLPDRGWLRWNHETQKNE